MTGDKPLDFGGDLDYDAEPGILDRFLPARRGKRGTCYDNVAGWAAVGHTSVLYQNSKTYLKTFSNFW